MSYYLMNGDDKVYKFNIDCFDVEILKIYNGVPPISVTKGIFTFDYWLKRRYNPSKRKRVEKVLYSSASFSVGSLLEHSYLARTTDSYWVKDEVDTVCFRDISLYNKDKVFDKSIADYMLNGSISPVLEDKTTFTPEITTDGMLDKCWNNSDGVLRLEKAGTRGFRNTGNEPYAEYFITQVLEVLGFNHISYTLAERCGRLVSVCNSFTTEDIGYSSYHYTFKYDRNKVIYGLYKEIYANYKELGFAKEFCEIMLLDALVVNTDRHLGNLGFLINNKTQEILKPTPIFDNGLGLLVYEEFDTLDDAINSNYCNHSKLSLDFIHAARELLCLHPELRCSLENLKDFKFRQDTNYMCSSKRLNILNGFIQYRLGLLLR